MLNVKLFMTIMQVLPILLDALQKVVETIDRDDMAKEDAHGPMDAALAKLSVLKTIVEHPRTTNSTP